jgi:NAD+ kinase
VALVLKRTVVDDVQQTQDERMLALMAVNDITVQGAEPANAEHHATAELVESYLRSRGCDVQLFEREQLPAQLVGFDLVITTGGDGTFLSTASRVTGTPMLGIKSAASSLAHHCLADWETFPEIIERILVGLLKPHRLLRLVGAVHPFIVDGKNSHVSTTAAFEIPILNDILVHDICPAATSRFFIAARGKMECHEGSGLWIGSAAGSTGALRSAGGKQLHLTERKFEFISREACIKPNRPRYELLRRVLSQKEELLVISKMRNGMLYADGQYRSYKFPIGDRLYIRRNPQDLIAFVNPDLNERYEYFFGVYKPW